MINCLLTGVGGQGTVLASKLLAHCAIERGLAARTAETIGMAQRGGSVVSHVRIGDDGDISKIYSPLIPSGCADIIIGFEPGEAVRSLHYLKKGGTVVVGSRAIKPTTDSLGKTSYEAAPMLDYLRAKVEKLVVVDSESICNECGSSRVLNIVLLGAACASGGLGISEQDMISAITAMVKPAYLQMNLRAFGMGIRSAEA